VIRSRLIERLDTARAEAPRRVRSGTAVRRRGDYDLNPGMGRPERLTKAAVLVPLVQRDEGVTVLLTQRTDHLADHAGQISFPGGRIEKGDSDAIAAALREAEEEIGLLPHQVEPIGRLDDYETRTGFLVVPVVALVAPPLELRADPVEVADIFEIPLDFVLEPANHQRHERAFAGAMRQFYVLPYEDRFIWGATAGMLVNLYEVLSA